MIDVKLVKLSEKKCSTRLWCSEKILEIVNVYPNQRFWVRVKRFYEEGFWLAERSSPPIVKHEWRQVYRIGFIDDLFRVIGFYEDQSKHDFMAIDSFRKRGQNLSKAQRKIIDHVANIRETKAYRKVEDNE